MHHDNDSFPFHAHAQTHRLHRPHPHRALQADQTRIQTQAVAQDSLLRFDGGETVALADLLHICLVLGTTGAARRPASSCRRWTV